jgi:hypothetical protein
MLLIKKGSIKMEKTSQQNLFRCNGPLLGCLESNCRHFYDHNHDEFFCKTPCIPRNGKGVEGAKCIPVSDFNQVIEQRMKENPGK